MLLLVTRRTARDGFLLRRRADRGKVPPTATGLAVGGHMAVRLELSGRRRSAWLPYLRPYRARGDVLVASRELEPALGYNRRLVEEYARRQCVNFCLAALGERGGEKRQVVLLDPPGECVGVAAELLAVCSTVMVFTRQSEQYLPCAAYTAQRYGARPLFLSLPVPAADLIVAPYGTGGLSLPPGVPVAAPDGLLYPRREDLTVPDDVAASLPADMDPLAVTAGLFAAFYPPDLMRATPASIHRGGQRITPAELFL